MNKGTAEEATKLGPTEEAGISDRDKEFATLLAQSIAEQSGVAMQDALAHVKGVVTRRPKRPEAWPKRVLPDRCPPGYAVICDDKGAGSKMVPVSMVCPSNRGTLVMGMEGMSEPHSPGSLWDQVSSKQMIVAHFTPVPNLRSDGKPVMAKGQLRYPNDETYTRISSGPAPWETSFYHPVYGAAYYNRAKG